jgi:antitoxin HicB
MINGQREGRCSVRLPAHEDRTHPSTNKPRCFPIRTRHRQDNSPTTSRWIGFLAAGLCFARLLFFCFKESCVVTVTQRTRQISGGGVAPPEGKDVLGNHFHPRTNDLARAGIGARGRRSPRPRSWRWGGSFVRPRSRREAPPMRCTAPAEAPTARGPSRPPSPPFRWRRATSARPGSGSSHATLKHEKLTEIITVPAHKPIKPIYVRKLVDAIDEILGRKELSQSQEYRPVFRRLSEDEGGGWLVEFPDLPGCMADGETLDEVLAEAKSAVAAWIDTAEDDGRPVPKPSSVQAYSGKWVQRVPKSLRAPVRPGQGRRRQSEYPRDGHVVRRSSEPSMRNLSSLEAPTGRSRPGTGSGGLSCRDGGPRRPPVARAATCRNARSWMPSADDQKGSVSRSRSVSALNRAGNRERRICRSRGRLDVSANMDFGRRSRPEWEMPGASSRKGSGRFAGKHGLQTGGRRASPSP